jgi:glutathione S-transferase
MNPAHCCPTLQFSNESDGAIWESAAVMRCLCNSFEGGEELYPTDAIKRGKIDMVLDWKNSTLYPDLFHIAYMMFGVAVDEDMAKTQFGKLIDTHFPMLLDTFLKDTKFCYSDTPTIADLAVAPMITLLKGRKKFWEKVPEGVKEYYGRVLEAFPGMGEYVKLLDDMCSGYVGPGADAEP